MGESKTTDEIDVVEPSPQIGAEVSGGGSGRGMVLVACVLPKPAADSAPRHCPLPGRLRWPLRPRRDWGREDFVDTLLIHIDHLPTPVHTFKLVTNDRNPP
jgi:hypothetical protein